MERKRIKFTLEWSTVEPWVIKTCRRNAWRTAPAIDEFDLVQKAFLLFLRCQEKYGDSARNARHLASLFRSAFVRKIDNWSRDRTVYLNNLDGYRDVAAEQERRGRHHAAEVIVKVSLEDAPYPLRKLFRHFADGAKHPQRRLKPGCRRRRETRDELLARLTGLPAEDVCMIVEAFFRGENLPDLD